jgi:hypothetical protein
MRLGRVQSFAIISRKHPIEVSAQSFDPVKRPTDANDVCQTSNEFREFFPRKLIFCKELSKSNLIEKSAVKDNKKIFFTKRLQKIDKL